MTPERAGRSTGIRPRRSLTRPRTLGSVLLLAALVVLGVAVAPTGAGATSGVTVLAVVANQPLAKSSDDHATKLDPTKPATITLHISNQSSATISVRSVKLEGRVLDLDFFAYDTAVAIDVPAGRSATLSFPLDLTGLDGQATGLLPGTLKILDARHNVLATQSFVANVEGSLWSVYGLFGLALLVLTGLSLAGVLLALARHRLPANRWQRGLRFLTPGLGVGLVITFFLSAVRVFVPRVGSWIIFAAVFAAVFFVIGYFSPAPDAEGEDTDIDEGLTLEHDGTVTAPARTGR